MVNNLSVRDTLYYFFLGQKGISRHFFTFVGLCFIFNVRVALLILSLYYSIYFFNHKVRKRDQDFDLEFYILELSMVKMAWMDPRLFNVFYDVYFSIFVDGFSTVEL